MILADEKKCRWDSIKVVNMTKLKRELRLFDVVFYGIGLILGAGIYALIGGAAELTGNSIWMSFLIAAAIASLTGLSYAELSTMFPKSAAEYLYVKNAFDNKSLSFLIGWLEVFGDFMAVSTVALGFGSYFSALFGVPMVTPTIGLILILSFVNFLGIKQSSRVNILFTSIEVAGLLTIIFIGTRYIGNVNYLEFPNGLSGLFRAAGIIFFAYLGFEEMVNVGEEVKNPKKNLPRAIIISVIISTIIYILVALSSVSVVDWKELANSNAPLAQVASKVFGNTGFILMSFIALFATSNTVLIFLIVGSRMVYGMSKDGSLPRIFSRVHHKTKTPFVSIFWVMIFSILFVLFGNIVTVASLVDFIVFLIFVFVNLSLIILRYKKPELKRTFKVPLNIRKFPIIPLLGLISSLFMLFQFELNIILVVVVVGFIGYVVYRLQGRE